MALFSARAATDCLFSTVRNTDTVEHYFGFLPYHGRRLAAGEELTVWGDVQHHLTRQTPNERGRRALELALDSTDPAGGQLVIAKSPSPHLFDLTLDETKILDLANGTLGVIDPCWGAYSSSE
jgi:hypothetical protein